MSKTDPVEIVVDIVDNFSDELKELNAKLEKIDKKKISVEFEIDSEGEIKKVKAQLQQLKKDINTNLDIDTQGASKAQVTKAALSKDMHSTLHIDTDRDSLKGVPPPVMEPSLQRARGVTAPDRGSILNLPDGPQRDFMQSIRDHDFVARRTANAPSVPYMPSSVGEFFEGERGFHPDISFGGISPGDALTGPRGMDDSIDLDNVGKNARRRVRKLAGSLDKLRPNIMMVWNALAALIPVFVTLGAAAIGLAGGMIAVATAGAAILGLGLLGWGDSFGSSMENLQQQAQKLGSNLFDVMQPAARTAQPIMQDWMEGAPRQVQKLVDPLEELMLAFEGTLGQIGAGIVDWIVRVVESMTAMEGIISQITLRFGGIAGDFLINFMENMIKFAHRNQDVLIMVASALGKVFAILLDVSIVVVRVLAVLAPFIAILEFITDILSNRLVASILAAITAIVLMNAALATLTSMTAASSAGIIGNLVVGLKGYIMTAYQAVSATLAWIGTLSTLRAVLATTGIGLAAIAAGTIAYGAMDHGGVFPQTPTGAGGTAGGSGGGTNIVVQGDVEKRQMDRLLDEVPKASRNERNTSEQMDL